MRYTLRDPELPNQIVIGTVGHQLSVSCNCLSGVDGQSNHYSPIEIRSLWTWAEAKLNPPGPAACAGGRRSNNEAAGFLPVLAGLAWVDLHI